VGNEAITQARSRTGCGAGRVSGAALVLGAVLGGCVLAEDLSDVEIRNDCGFAVLAEVEANLDDLRQADRLKRFGVGETADSSAGQLDALSLFVEVRRADDSAGPPLEIEILREDFVLSLNGDVLLVLSGDACPW